MGNYRFTITAENASGIEPIKIGYDDDSVKSVSIDIDTLDDNVSQKSSAMLARVTIKGAITSDNHEELKKIFEWSKDFKKASTYRQIQIESQMLTDDDVRKYVLDQVFVCDYKESFGVSKEGVDGGEKRPEFELKLTQFQNNWDGVIITVSKPAS